MVGHYAPPFFLESEKEMRPTKNQTEIYNDKDHYLKEELETIEETIETYLMLWERHILTTFKEIGFDALAKKMLQEKKEKVNGALTNIKNSLCDGRCINE